MIDRVALKESSLNFYKLPIQVILGVHRVDKEAFSRLINVSVDITLPMIPLPVSSIVVEHISIQIILIAMQFLTLELSCKGLTRQSVHLIMILRIDCTHHILFCSLQDLQHLFSEKGAFSFIKLF